MIAKAGDRVYIVTEGRITRWTRQESGAWTSRRSKVSASDSDIASTIKYRKCFLARAGSNVIEGYLGNDD